MKVRIAKLDKKEASQALKFITEVIKDSFKWEGFESIPEFSQILESELQIQRDRIESYLQTELPLILVAKLGHQIVGSIAYYYPSKAVQQALNKLDQSPVGLMEIIASYVKTDLQRQGLGQQLFAAIQKRLKQDGYTSFAVSTGYKKGMQFWKKQLGGPTVIIEKYYDPVDCFVWIKELK